MTCTHEIVVCKCCGKEATPAQMLASRPRTRGEKAKEQSKEAGKLGGRPRKEPK